MTTIVSGPKIDERAEQPYMGIRVQVPMKGMFVVVGKLFKELHRWEKANDVIPAGPPLLRYHVIDMQGEMDIEACIPVTGMLQESERIKPDVVPAGRYASLIYVGNGYTGNKTLIEWAKASGLQWDRWDDPKGDGFRARYESYLTDPEIEPKKTKWEVEVAIKMAES